MVLLCYTNTKQNFVILSFPSLPIVLPDLLYFQQMPSIRMISKPQIKMFSSLIKLETDTGIMKLRNFDSLENYYGDSDKTGDEIIEV